MGWHTSRTESHAPATLRHHQRGTESAAGASAPSHLVYPDRLATAGIVGIFQGPFRWECDLFLCLPVAHSELGLVEFCP